MAIRRPLDVQAELLDEFRRNGAVTAYLVTVLPEALWHAAPPGRPRGRTIAAIAAHIQGVRRTFARLGGARPGPASLDRRLVTQEAASRALLQSTDILVELFETALTAGRTRVKGMPRRVVNMLVYLIQHDAHHRGQIVMMAGDLGHRLSGDETMRIWGWKAMPPAPPRRGPPYTAGMTRARRLALPFALAAGAAVVIVVAARQSGGPSPADAFTIRDEMIPMRDGVKLYTRIFAPKNQSGPLPFVFRRTPYGIDGADGSFVRYYKALADEGYIFVFQDIRGKFKSEGTFVMQRPARAPGDTTSLDEGTDTYDTIEWLLKNVPNHNGRVGMLGVSYDGWTTIMGALEPHPALKAISPQASPVGHVARRRLPSQRRVPPELRVRVRHDDGDRART